MGHRDYFIRYHSGNYGVCNWDVAFSKEAAAPYIEKAESIINDTKPKETETTDNQNEETISSDPDTIETPIKKEEENHE